MSEQLITLTTDFGEGSPYVAVMKGVILSIHKNARIVDLSHEIPPQNVEYGSYFLATALPYFPPGAVHVAVVDPGVGTDRAILLAEMDGQFILAPDNGLLTGLLERRQPQKIWQLTEARYWRSIVSDTFHGRDIFAPVAAHLALSPSPALFGKPHDNPVRLPGARFQIDGYGARGVIQFVDHFGNLISNIPSSVLTATPRRVSIENRPVENLRWVKTYGEACTGEIVGLISSDGFVEIAVVNENAAKRLNMSTGAAIEIGL